MAAYKIYHKDGSVLADANGKEIEVHSIEYNGTWMGECFVTVTFENEAPIDFSIGDYIVYRNERFEINYDPGKIKCSSKDSYGGAFKYDSVKFNALSDELVRCDMLDLVLYDNNLHYTALPQFVFYVESLDDLLDRIQANLDELYGKAAWKLYSRNKERSIQRGCTAEGWESAYGTGTADNVIDSTSISISDQNCWDALSLVNSQFDVNFIIRDRNVYVGTAGVPTANIFKYGKDKGLYEIEQNSESDQAIVTRLRAYGSNRNLPNHYYADLGSIPFLNITGDYHDGSTDSGLSVMMEDSVYAGMFTDIISDNGSNTKHCRIRGSIGGYEFDGEVELVKKDSTKSTTRLLAEGKEVSDAIKAKIDAGIVEVDFIRGANKAKFNGNRINYVSNLPNNMACDRLMLPGFPNKSLKEWWDAQSAEKKVWLNPSGKEHIFSNDIYRPYVDSLNIEKIGVRPSSVFFDQDDKVNGIVEIYPTIEEMEVDGVRIDEIYTGTNVEDDGRFGDDVSDIANVAIYLSPKINFDIRGLMQDDFTIHMKDGMCAGREFKVAGCTKQNDGSWKLMIERKPDDSLNLYFPYNEFQIKKGDHFVLSGIELPDAYVEAASEKLLRYCIAYLDKNDYTRYVYQPKVDEIFMARQHDTAMADASGLTKSLYLTLKEGDIMLFKDDDLGIDAEITIDQLTIKEEDGKIPTYEITLREEKEVGTIQKIQNQISSITNGNGGSFTGGTGGGGLSSSQIKNLIDAIGSDRFLSKLNPDTAAGIITFLQGTNWGNFTSETGAAMTVDPTTGQTYMEVDRLKVRLKAFFEQLEIQKVGYVGGKLIVTKGQGVDILDVENIYDSEGNVSAYRCYFLGEQEGRKIDNLLRVKDQMICKDFNVSEGTTDGATNKYYWRLATAVSTDVVKRGNNVCHWVDLSATDCDTNSDIPEIGDTICHLGNREDTDRQGAEILSVVDANSPSFTIYAGINSYSLVDKEYIDMGVSGGKAFCNIYGSTYIGDRNRENGYISWDYDKEENVWKMRVKGTIDITSQLSSGGTIGGAINNAANAYKDDFSTFTSNVNEIIGGFQAQIDGVIETWFYDPEPTLDNLPASEWKDNTTKDKHLGDLYYSKSGLAYRFQKEGDIYKWVQIDDTAITSALKEAKAAKEAAAAAQGTADTAQTTAESKMKVFVQTPTNSDEYSVGDMWVNATYPADGSTYNNEILHCVTKKAAGEAFSISHWAQSSNIKTQFNNFVNNTYAEDKKDFYNQLDGKVETWYQKDDPKDKWAAADYSKHKGDIWYNDSENKSYRWTGTAWVELKDQAAIDAKTLAESKKRVFTTTTLPTPPYDKKDLWVQGENGDIMVCVTPKASGATASASDWEKASKYTDDTAAKAAQKTANDAATAAQEINASITAIDGNVDVALKDKIITKTEAAAIKEALKGLEAIMADVNKTKKELEDNAVYKSIADDVKTDYSDAYKALSAAFTALSDYINNTLLVANPITDEILSSYTFKYSNFKTKYEDYVSKLTVVRNSMDALLNTRIGDIATMLGGLKATTDAMNESTQINGGLILSSLLALGYTNNSIFNVMSGVSGLYESGETGGGIAFWAGGHRIDINNCTKNADGTYSIGGKVVNPADFLVRHDGTGYAAGGKMWWDENGKIHADPQSFLINEEYVGNVMQLFKFEYSGDTEFTNIVHAIPQKPFESLSVGANGLTLYNGDKSAKFYIKDGVLFLEGDLAVTGGITMYATDGVTSGLLDQVYAILDSTKFEIKNGVITIKGEIGDGKVKGATLGGVAVTLNANGILEFDAYPTTLPASDVYAWAKAATKPTYSWGEITEKPTSFTPSAHTHDDRYYTESEIDTKLGLKLDTSLKGAADGLATLDSSGKVPSSQLPSYVDDVLECINKASFPTTGESGKIYIDQTTNLTYRWGGSAYVEISQSLALGETSSTAYAGDKGKKNTEDIAALKTGKADKATTLSGYGITDAYTKKEVNTKLTDGSVTKIGTKDVGSATLPIYLKAGVPTACNTTLGVSITGNSATATKLKTSITLWGQSFDGSANVSGNMTGVGTITPTGEDLKVVGNLIVTGGIVMYADDGATIESGFAALLAAHIDGVTIKYNESQQKIYSVMTGIKVNGATYKPNETDGYITIPDYPTSLDWANIENKPSTFTPSSHTHSWDSITSKPCTLISYSRNGENIDANNWRVGECSLIEIRNAELTYSNLAMSGYNSFFNFWTPDGVICTQFQIGYDAFYYRSKQSASATITTNWHRVMDSNNCSVSKSGETLTVKINGTSQSLTNTWRGIQDNLTSSTNTTESLSAKQGYLLANGSARDNTKLPLSGGTLTGDLYINANLYGPAVGSNPRNIYGSEFYFYNCNSSTTSAYNFGLYQWNDEFQFTYRASADNTFRGTAFVIQGSDGQVTFTKTPKVGSTLVSLDGHTHPYLPLSGGTMSGNITYTGIGTSYIGNGENDAANGVGGALNNLVISSWNGVSFTTSCLGQAYTGTNAVSIDCRNGYVYANTFIGALSGNATTATTASKLGTTNVGSGTQHFYLNGGTATASTSTVGGTAKPMYLNGGVMTAISATVGGTAKPIFLNAGTLTAISATVGSASKPVYLNGGSVTACDYDFTSYLPLAGGTMGGTAWIVWPDSGNWGNSNSGVTFPVTRGGLQWIGQSDWVKLFSQETSNDNLDLVLQFADDNSNGLSIRNNGGSQTAFISAAGHITAANGTVRGTLNVGAIPVTNSSTGVLKIDGNLIVTGGISMYATDGVASGLMEQILVDGTTIGKKADGTLYAINTGNVRSIVMGTTTYTPNDSGAVTLPEKVTWANIEGKPSSFTPSAHTHSDYVTALGTNGNYLIWTKNGSTSNITVPYATSATSAGRTKFLETFLQGSTTDTYGSSYPIWAQWSDGSNVRLKCTNYTVWTNKADYATSSGNAATATKLQTARNIFGLPFDGTSDIGTLSFLVDSNIDTDVSSIKWTAKIVSKYTSASTGGQGLLIGTATDRKYCRGGGIAAYATDTWGNDTNLAIYKSQGNDYDVKPVEVITITGNLNVGIGTSSPSYKLHTVGDIYSSTYIRAASGFVKANSSDSYVLLGGGGHKAESSLSVASAASATKLTSSAGSATLPIYFSDGKPVACTASSVFSNLSNSGNNISVTVAGQNRTLTVGYADTVDGYHADSFIKKHAEYKFGSDGTAPYNYVWLCRIGNTNSYSGLALTLDVNSRYHKHYQINMLISTGQYAYSDSSISIDKSDGAPDVYYVRTANGSDVGYDYYDIYVTCSAWNWGGYKITNSHDANGYLSFTNKCTLVDSVPSGAVAVGLMYSSVNYATSASKWQTARKITLTGSVTGSVSIDGSGDVTLATTTNHTHSYAGSASAGGAAYSANKLTTARSIFGQNFDGSAAINGQGVFYGTYNSTANARYGSSALQIRENGLVTTNQSDLAYAPSIGFHWSGRTAATLLYGSDSIFYLRKQDFTTRASLDANLVGNAATASKWATARTLTLTGSVTGSVSIDGSGNVSLATTTNHTHAYLPLAGGTMTGTINANANVQNTGIKFNNNNANLNAFNDQHLILGKAIRFGDYNTWDWNVWAGLKYDSADKTIYLGLADGTTFNANNAQSGGSLRFPGVSTVYAPTFSGALSGNASTATNADKLDGVHYENILDRTFTKASRMSSAGWYRIAQTNTYNGHGASFILVINRLFNNNNNEAYTFSVNITYSGVAITQISGYANDTLIPKIRIDKPSGNNTCYVDIYYNSSSGNDVRYFTIGNAVCMSATANPTLVGTATEFSTSDGISTNKNILADGGITMHNTSDRRLKKNIRGFNACDELMKLGGVYQFEYIDEEIERNKIYKGSHIGLLYQNVKGTILDKMCFEREDGYGALNYLDTSFISLLAGVGVEHETRLRGIEGAFKKYESKTDKKIRLMKKKINDLEARIKELEERRTA